MTPDEAKKLDREICNRWKGKFNADDLRYWRQAMGQYELSDVVGALTHFRNNSKFTPKVKEIVAILSPQPQPQASAGRSNTEREGTFADILRRQNRQYAGRSDAEVYCRYWRAMFFMAASRETVAHWIESRCIAHLRTIEGMTEARRCASFISASAEMFRSLLDELRGQPTAADLEAVEQF